MPLSSNDWYAITLSMRVVPELARYSTGGAGNDAVSVGRAVSPLTMLWPSGGVKTP